MEAEFLRHILENPEDLSARRVFADWLMEQPEPERRDRGEFIALQCELAGKVKPAARRAEMEARERALLGRYAETWTAPFRHLVKGYAFRHGFVECVRMDLEALVLEGEELFRHAPITELTLNALRSGDALELTGSAHLGQIVSLDLSRCDLDDTGLTRLLQSPYLGSLRRLNLDNSAVGDAGMRDLTLSTYFSRLTHLSLVRSRVGTAGIGLLLHSGACHLTHLRLNGLAGFGPAQARALLMSLALILEQDHWRQAQRLLSPLEDQIDPRRFYEMVARLDADTIDFLSRAVGHANARVRALAVKQLGYWHGNSALPALVRRSFDRQLRPAVVSTIVEYFDHLGRNLWHWLNELRLAESAEAALDKALGTSELPLPAAVQAEFADLCLRRARWRAGHGRANGPGTKELLEMLAGLAAEAHAKRSALCELVLLVAQLAVEAALRHAGPDLPEQRAEAIRTRSRERESAWFAGWLFQLLQKHESASA